MLSRADLEVLNLPAHVSQVFVFFTPTGSAFTQTRLNLTEIKRNDVMKVNKLCPFLFILILSEIHNIMNYASINFSPEFTSLQPLFKERVSCRRQAMNSDHLDDWFLGTNEKKTQQICQFFQYFIISEKDAACYWSCMHEANRDTLRRYSPDRMTVLCITHNGKVVQMRAT